MIRFFERIKRVIDWIPVIWNNDDFDHIYVLKLLKYKLERMRKLFIECSYCDHTDDIVYITYTIDTLNRLIEDDYCVIYSENAFEQEDKDWARLIDLLEGHLREWWD